MPAVHKRKSQAKDHNDGAGRGRGRAASRRCSRFVLILGLVATLSVRVSLEYSAVTCQVPSAWRDSAPAAKLQLPEDRSVTIGWRPFNQA